MPNFEGMTADMATVIGAVLVVVFFGYLLAAARIGRAQGEIGWTRSSAVAIATSFALVIAGFAFSQLQLLAVIQEGSVSGDDAIAVWIAAGFQFVLPVAATAFIEIAV